MSVRDYAILQLGRRASSAGSTVGGGVAVITTGQHQMDGPEHLGQEVFQKVDEKGVADGYAPLDNGILVPIAYLPVGPGAAEVAAGDHDHDSDYAAIAHALDDHSDTNLDSPTDGYLVAWDDATSRWIAVAPPSGALPSPSTAGDIAVWNGSAWVILPAGSDDEVLTADSGETEGIKWAAGGGGGAAAYHEASNAATQSLSASADLCVLTATVVAGTYRVIADYYVNHGEGTAPGSIQLYSDEHSALFGSNRDSRNNKFAMVSGFVALTAGSRTIRLKWTRESGTATFGLSNDPRWARHIKMHRIGS